MRAAAHRSPFGDFGPSMKMAKGPRRCLCDDGAVPDTTRRSLPLEMRLDWVAEVLDSLPMTVPHRRAALLAAGGAAYQPEAPVTDYAPAIMELDDDVLEELARAAHNSAITHPNHPQYPLAEDERVRYLAEVKEVAQEVESDSDLAPADRRHVQVLVQELTRALEAAPQTGAPPVETAAKAVVGDVAVYKGLWQRLSSKPWAKRLWGVAGALIVLVSAYSSAKDLVSDAASIWLGQPLAIVAELHPPQTQSPESETGHQNDVHDAETIPEDYTDEPR